MRGLFIVFEGTDGSGKSTQAKRLCTYLNHLVPTYLTREPGGTPMAEELRNTALAFREEVVTPITELLVMFAARQQHIHNLIRPLRDKNTWVISDRFVDSSYAYQVIAGQCSPSLFHSLYEEIITPDDVPDLTIVVDIGNEERRRRLELRTDQHDRLDLAEAKQRLMADYLRQQVTDHPERYVLVDGNGTEDVVFQRVIEALRSRFLTHLPTLTV